MEELIKAALKKAGLSEDLTSQINVQTEDEIEGAVANLKAQQEGTKKPLADFLKENGYEDDFKKMIQSETDRRVTQAIKTYEDKHKADPNTKSKANEENENLTEDQKTIKALQDQVNSLTTLVQGQVNTQKGTELRTKATKAIKDAGLPEKWADRINVEKEEDIAGEVKKLETEYTELKQQIVNDQLDEHGVPIIGSGNPVTETKIDEFAKTLDSEKDGVPVEKLD